MLSLYVLLVVLIVAYVLFRRPKTDPPTVIDGRLQAPPVVTAANLGIAARARRSDWSEFDVPAFIRRQRQTVARQ